MQKLVSLISIGFAGGSGAAIGALLYNGCIPIQQGIAAAIFGGICAYCAAMIEESDE